MAGPVPVTVLTGFLGAGKTTLLNRLLREPQGRRLGVIVNEFGEIGVDGALLADAAGDGIVEMSDGCVCCAARGDLVRGARALLAAGTFDAILVETTGLARPGPVAQAFLLDPELAEETTLSAVVAVADAAHVEARLDAAAEGSREAAEQIAFADRIVLNKTDLADPAALARVEARLRRLNPHAPLIRAERGAVDPEALLAPGEPRAADAAAGEDEPHDHDHAEEDAHGHAHGHAHGPGGGHVADSGLGSVSLRSAAPMDAARLDRWFSRLLAERGDSILRAKGVIRLAGEERRLVLQAVHTLYEGTLDRPWRADEPRESALVFIGRDLDAAALRAGFEGCAAD